MKAELDWLRAVRVVRARRKTIAIHVLRNGDVEVRAPRWVARHAINGFLLERESWIRKQQQKQASLPAVEKPVYAWGETLRVWGSARILVPGPLTSLAPELLMLRLGPGSDAVAIERCTQTVLRKTFIATARERLDHWAAHPAFVNIPQASLSVRKMTRRWGSCRKSGRITLNLNLIKYPQECLDAVIVHELSHLVHFNHGAAFYALMTLVYPAWREVDQCLQAEALRY